MGWFAGLLGARRSAENPTQPLTSEALTALFAGPATAAGAQVSIEAALRQVTVFSCVRLIAETVGMLPLVLYRRLPRGKERATERPLYSLLHTAPNPELTAQELYETIAGHLALWGNAYCEIEIDAAGRRRALWPLRPDRMTVATNPRNEREYAYLLPSGQTVRLPRWRVWHVRGWGTDAWLGKSPIGQAREAVGLALATEEYGARFFSNGSRPGGILRHPKQVSDASANRLRASWEAAFGGLSQSNRVAVLEEGIEWQAVGVPPEEAQFLQTRQYQDTQICSLYRVPPHMVGITTNSTSWGTGIAEQGQGYLSYTLQPYLSRIAQSAARDLLSANERASLFAEHITAGVVRLDITKRYSAYAVGRTGGWLSVNDIREMENLNPVDGGDGYLQPLNMAALGAPEETDDEQKATD